MSFYPCTIAVASFFRENRIVGLHHSRYDCKDIIRTPHIAVRRLEWSLPCYKSVLISKKLVKILDMAADNTGFFYLTHTPMVELASFIDFPHNALLCIEAEGKSKYRAKRKRK